MSEGANLTGAKADVYRLFVAIVKLALVSEAADIASWRQAALDAQERLAGEAGTVASLHLDGLWVMAVKAAERDPVVQRDETVNPMLPARVPVPWESLTAQPFDLDNAVQAIRDAASFG